MGTLDLAFNCVDEGLDFDLVVRVEYCIHDALPAYRDPGGNIIDPPSPAYAEVTAIKHTINNDPNYVALGAGPLYDAIAERVETQINESGELADHQVAA